ncbi:hypothetical protein E1B28_006843 [Marasmius oreades]|uniref:F-box domain-containing protein n=1 Tax=Marasmius oreades TaxID=181124 RepID=A0A9P7UX14_9AGAR|nr:uncharacterized protein E1B28_006843 [Marasmius oreades]KAG7096170.1 hypothetical protein E1B28_006843 [Marasmius oreades]
MASTLLTTKKRRLSEGHVGVYPSHPLSLSFFVRRIPIEITLEILKLLKLGGLLVMANVNNIFRQILASKLCNATWDKVLTGAGCPTRLPSINGLQLAFFLFRVEGARCQARMQEMAGSPASSIPLSTQMALLLCSPQDLGVELPAEVYDFIPFITYGGERKYLRNFAQELRSRLQNGEGLENIRTTSMDIVKLATATKKWMDE